ncbi:D-Ala-D-Ala carboxypeptidase family metallohydrolase [Massilibacteroides vaginae]|jgi:zinc D-Ala-D-Ala carboxypeptidase|uniref:D-Ala-D-Ala carboxypeptidase family metallohydrolase n=1 Tax=Massilibacteroides vaginae TaxID=1673718 RepID=UPI000A1CA11A|nr:D-Ala-D-Ala carboxypeptidase family metallohydrolase [Massilibacteroides vaginae]
MKQKSNELSNGEIRLSEHFRLQEFTYSRVAIENGIENAPPLQVIEALRNLCVRLLEPLRVCCGNCPMHILSGYRCSLLNKRVGGVSSSQHLTGEAADLYMTDFGLLIRTLRSVNSPEFDQAIYYVNRNFVHLSYSSTGINRQQLIYV